MAAASDQLKVLIDKGDIDGVEKFIKNGGDVNGFYDDGNTPLLYAIELELKKETILLLLCVAFKFGLKEKIEREKSEKIILCLINAGSEVNPQLPEYKSTPLKYALMCSTLCSNVIFALLNAGADVNVPSRRNSPLISAIFSNYDESIIADLIRRGADVNHRGDCGGTPLHFAVKCNDNFEIATMLIDAGANVNTVDDDDRNELFGICCDNKCCRDNCDKNKKLIDLLLDKGADIKQIDKEGRSVMHHLHRSDMHPLHDTCNYLISLCFKSGLSINLKDNKGETPLMYAVKWCDAIVKSLLFLYNADVNCVDNDLNTALHHAYCFDKSCNLLLYCGSDMFARNRDNKTPLDQASFKIDDAFRHVRSIEYLRKNFYGLAIFKYYLLFIDDNNFSDYFKNCSDDIQKYVELFKSEHLKEVGKLKNTFLKDDLSFYDFIVLKRFRNNKTFINISFDQCKYTKKQIKEQFPLYCNSIILRIKDNQMEK